VCGPGARRPIRSARHRKSCLPEPHPGAGPGGRSITHSTVRVMWVHLLEARRLGSSGSRLTSSPTARSLHQVRGRSHRFRRAEPGALMVALYLKHRHVLNMAHVQQYSKAQPTTTALQTCTLQAGALNHNDGSEAARFAREGRAQLWPAGLLTDPPLITRCCSILN
jgi:hypothetical protein